MEQDKQLISYADFLYLINKLYRDIKTDNTRKFDYIVPIFRGGLIPAVYLSHSLGIPIIKKLPRFYKWSKKNFLIVEDVVETGKTLEKIFGKDGKGLRENVCIASLITKGLASFSPCYCGMYAEKWVVFPWEQKIDSGVA